MAAQPHLETVSGGVANFMADMALPLKECKVSFLPKQEGSGDPSPENVRPISGWDGCTVYRAGKNLFDKSATYPDSGKYLNSSGQLTSSANWTVTFIPVTAGTKYSISGIVAATTSAYHWWLNASKQPLSVIGVHNDVAYNEITAPVNSAYMGISWISNTSNASYDGNTLQVEVGSTSSYTPYSGQSYPVTWQSAGTVYGGYVDLVRGVLVAEWELASDVWSNIKTGSQNPTTGFYQGILQTVNDPKQILSPSQYGIDVFCNIMNLIRWEGYSYTPEHFYSAGQQYKKRFQIIGNWDDNQVISVVFRLETPITYTLTPQQITTLIGTNNIWSDAWNVELTYWSNR